ncbi:MAG: NAD(P)/FAD-dependent oxidoreductase [bacterium]
MFEALHTDVAIIGGGPAGTTLGTILKKYMPELRVTILERDVFPRDHIGESQLPQIMPVLHEMGVWDKVEAANFPIKIGATYRWGKTDELWDFEFLNNGKFDTAPRPAKYAGQRLETAFQVDRAIYDKILLDHAAEMGCEVREATQVTKVMKEGDRVEGLKLKSNGVESTLTAKYYIDASGHVGILRREMGVAADSPTTLQNIAIWDYWQNADWAVNIGVGGTRIQIMSLGYGWMWFIPLGPTRTSLGLVIPAAYYKEQKKRPQDLYNEAVFGDKIISKLIRNATSENKLTTTKDWSFLADRLVGENWFLAGESAGFADPILSAGMTLAHRGARDIAYTIIALEKGEHDPEWLKHRYDESHRRHIGQHIRFADFWYTNNGLFSDLKDFTKVIAGDAGLEMSSDKAWQWFGTGGFIDPDSSAVDIGTYALFATKNLTASFSNSKIEYNIFGKSHFSLALEGAELRAGAQLENGNIYRHDCYLRDGKWLPLIGACDWLVKQLQATRTARQIIESADRYRRSGLMSKEASLAFPRYVIEALEAMTLDGWVVAEKRDGEPGWPEFEIDYNRFIHPNRDVAKLAVQD